MDRRTAVAGLVASLALPAATQAARLARPDTRIKAQPIGWPSGDGRALQGFMAIPGHASGKQPAVLVLADPRRAPGIGPGLAAAIAQAGLIACAPEAKMVAEAGADPTSRGQRDLEATIAWLGHNSYATGGVGLLGTDGTDALIARLAAMPGITAAVRIGGGATQLTASGSTPDILVLPATDLIAWAAAWPRAMAYLREHLQ